MNNQPPTVINLNLPKPPMRLIGAVLVVVALLIVALDFVLHGGGGVGRGRSSVREISEDRRTRACISRLPLGIDEVSVLPTRRQLKLEFGFYTSGYTNPDQPTGNRSKKNRW